ncbi:MAG TPA: hypothetical protein PK020_03275 [Ilumatobacteraceae bacterium]|nr:hypothetical protein [Ilumatobacteraceae bacterium]
MKRLNNTRRLALSAPLLACLLLAACGSDDDGAASTQPGISSTTASAAVDATTTPIDTGAGETSVTIVASDYSFGDVPASIAPGTRLALKNSSPDELHEMVVVRIPDAETRSIAELMALPEAEVDAIFGSGPPAIVQLSMPGSDEFIPALGDGTLTEPGRYAMVCFIPQGVDPQAYLDASSSSDGPPDVPGGPPHALLGMYAEFTVGE